MKKLILLFLAIFFANFVSAGNICCPKGCSSSTAVGTDGVTYQLKCCSAAGTPEQQGTAYLGCLGSDAKSYCLGDYWGDCFKCDYVGGKYKWVQQPSSCGECKDCVSVVDGNGRAIEPKSYCDFKYHPTLGIPYKCELGTTDCLVEGQVAEHPAPDNSNYYCCGLNQSGGYETGATNKDANYFTDYDLQQRYTGVYEKGVDERFVDKDGDKLYDQDSNDPYIEENIDDGAEAGIQTPAGASFILPVPDICDIEITPIDCSDGKDNDGDGKCDTGNCGNGMPADPDCAKENCVSCGFWPFCWKEKCETGFYRSSTGFGSCNYGGGLISPCCDDSDNDNICDAEDNCDRNSNGNEPLDNVDYNNDGDKLDNQNDVDNDGIGDACDDCPSVMQSETALSADSTKLCTASGELDCLDGSKCQMMNIGEEFFCNGNIWVNKYSCENFGDCFFAGDKEYYWIDNKDKICDLTTPQLIDTDNSDIVCELLEDGTQNGCNMREETVCWDNDASGANTKCCGDDGASDTWTDSQNKACFEGKFYMDADDLPELCELFIPATTEGGCDIHNEFGCWSNDKCCGDDADETWSYSTSNIIDDILPPSGCYNGKWFDRAGVPVTYYELSIIP